MTLLRLEPCPYCGCPDPNAERILNDRGCAYEWVVRCRNCGEEGQRLCAETPSTVGDAVEAWNRIGRVICQRNAEIKRLKKRIAELEKPDLFWPGYYDDTTPAESCIEELMEDMDEVLLPYNVKCARELPDIWAVRVKRKGREKFQYFPTEHEAEQFCKNIMEEGHD